MAVMKCHCGMIVSTPRATVRCLCCGRTLGAGDQYPIVPTRHDYACPLAPTMPANRLLATGRDVLTSEGVDPDIQVDASRSSGAMNSLLAVLRMLDERNRAERPDEQLAPQPMLATTREFSITSRGEEAVRLRDAVLELLRETHFAPSRLAGIRLALEEALTNAIRHGNAGDPDKHIHVSLAVSDRQVCIQITDEGNGFDPAAVPDPTTEENLARPHGRGLKLMRHFLDQVEHNDRGNAVTLLCRKN